MRAEPLSWTLACRRSPQHALLGLVVAVVLIMALYWVTAREQLLHLVRRQCAGRGNEAGAGPRGGREAQQLGVQLLGGERGAGSALRDLTVNV